jgi:pimeloyl-ACP methyl ester carboxylesterase
MRQNGAMTNNTATVVLVPGAWHGAWCWDMVTRRLDAAGVASVAIDNPSVARAPASLADDGDNLRRALDAIAGPVVLVGHSYGGSVITDAGAHPNVVHLVYLTSFPLDDGESVAANKLVGGEDTRLPEAMVFAGDLVHFAPERATEFFYHDCAPEVAAAAVAQLRPMSLPAMMGTPRAVAWREKPSTYVVCTDDRALPLALQQSAASRCGTVVEMPTSHSPFASQPDLVVDVLLALSV